MKLQNILNDTNYIVNNIFRGCHVTLVRGQTQIGQSNDTSDINKGNK